MSKYLKLPKRNYPPRCPGEMQTCKQTKCDIGYSWHKVFLSIPYQSWYEPYEKAIVRGLEEKGYMAEVVKNKEDLEPLSIAISRSICSSTHAIVDLSGEKGGTSASGVLIESGFIRSTIDNVIHLVREGTDIPTEFKTLIYKEYSNEEELKNIVINWVDERRKKYLEPIRSMLLNNDNIKDYSPWLHCIDFEAKPEKKWRYKIDCDWAEALTGGGSGYKLLENTFNILKTSEHNLMEPHRCSTKEMPLISRIPPFNKIVPFIKEPRYKKTKNILENSNLYLLDSPTTRNDKGCRKQPLNWIMEEAITQLRRKFFTSTSVGPLSVGMEIIHLGSKEAKEHPREKIKLTYGEIPTYKYADAAWDYGFIVRAPNPYNPQAIILMMAGIHAPASHAAAEVFAIPRRMRRLSRYLENRGVDPSNNPFFEAVFAVRRTYRKDGLGDLEWLHARELR